MRPSTKRILSVFASMVFLIAALVVYQNLIKPEFDEINGKRNELTTKKYTYETQKAAVDQFEGLLGQFQNLTSFQRSVNEIIPNRAEITQAVNQVEAISRSSNVIILGIDFKDLGGQVSKSPLVKRLGVVEIKIRLGGQYQDLKNFLKLLETNIRLTKVTSFSFSGLQQGFYNLNLTAEVYYQY